MTHSDANIVAFHPVVLFTVVKSFVELALRLCNLHKSIRQVNEPKFASIEYFRHVVKWSGPSKSCSSEG
jgi:hypothetical protein